jgi:hypothetical protein
MNPNSANASTATCSPLTESTCARPLFAKSSSTCSSRLARSPAESVRNSDADASLGASLRVSCSSAACVFVIHRRQAQGGATFTSRTPSKLPVTICARVSARRKPFHSPGFAVAMIGFSFASTAMRSPTSIGGDSNPKSCARNRAG